MHIFLRFSLLSFRMRGVKVGGETQTPLSSSDGTVDMTRCCGVKELITDERAASDAPVLRLTEACRGFYCVQ